MASVNQTRPQCVNQMGKTHSKLLAARRDMGTAWARHAMCKSALIMPAGGRWDLTRLLKGYFCNLLYFTKV